MKCLNCGFDDRSPLHYSAHAREQALDDAKRLLLKVFFVAPGWRWSDETLKARRRVLRGLERLKKKATR